MTQLALAACLAIGASLPARGQEGFKGTYVGKGVGSSKKRHEKHLYTPKALSASASIRKRVSMQSIVIGAALLGVAVLAAPLRTATAQELPAECLKSMAVDKTKVVVHYGWLPGGSSVVTPMSCEAAELLRGKLFVPGAISEADLSAALSENDPLTKQRQQLVAFRDGLDKPATKSQLRLLLEAQLFGISKTSLLYTCLTSTSNFVGIGWCAISAIGVFVSGYDLYGKAASSGTEMPNPDELRKALDQAIQMNERARADRTLTTKQKASELLRTAQVGLCQEIRQACKP